MPHWARCSLVTYFVRPDHRCVQRSLFHGPRHTFDGSSPNYSVIRKLHTFVGQNSLRRSLTRLVSSHLLKYSLKAQLFPCISLGTFFFLLDINFPQFNQIKMMDEVLNNHSRHLSGGEHKKDSFVDLSFRCLSTSISSVLCEGYNFLENYCVDHLL